MITQKTISKLLDLPSQVEVNPEKMADDIQITVYPNDEENVDDEVRVFFNKLKYQMEELGVDFIPFEESLAETSWNQRAKRVIGLLVNNITYIWNWLIPGKNLEGTAWMGLSALQNAVRKRRIKPGISVIALAEKETGNLPMDYVSSFRDTSVITILPVPDKISKSSSFEDHFTKALEIFSYHMTNIFIGVGEENWILYNFNASHPIFSRTENFEDNLKQALIPKIHAPITPPQLDNFTIEEEAFDAKDSQHKYLVEDMVKGGQLFGETDLYPDGKRLRELSFRNDFYEWIGKLHIDKRNGMSFGFLARQMPTEIAWVKNINDTGLKSQNIKSGYFKKNGESYIILNLTEKLVLRVPNVWVLTQRSGSDKTDMDPVNDLVKLGLKSGQMYLQTPDGVQIKDDYRPSFDTKVILAHALGNAITASVFDYFEKQRQFVQQIKNNGMAIAHWHGYIHPDYVPESMHVHGTQKPHVSCSSPQSAVFAFEGKINRVRKILESSKDYRGDIHIEPHHGININHKSLVELGKIMKSDSSISKLGNEYLELIK